MPSPQPSPDARQDACLCRRAVVLCLLLVTVFSLLGWRLVNLHLFQGETFRQVAREESVRSVELPALRGEILDATGEVLATDRRTFAVVIDRNLLRDFNLAIRTLASAEGKKAADIVRYYGSEPEIREASIARAMEFVAPRLKMTPQALRSEIGDALRGEVVVARDIGDEQAQILKDLVEEKSIPGVFVRESFKRFYPEPDRAVHVLGFTNSENIGVEGVEKSMNPVLAGQKGVLWLERDVRGDETRSTSHPSYPPTPGHSVRLTIDLAVQKIVEEEIDLVGSGPNEVYLPAIRPKRVTVILTDPASGSILALANRPQHSLTSRVPLTPNFAVAETYEPGSIFKISAYIGALDPVALDRGALPRPLVNLNTPLKLRSGRYDQGDIHIRDEHPLGDASVITAFAHSSNIGAFLMAQQLGPARFHGYIKALGFGDRTGVEMPNEASGRVRQFRDWEVTSMPSVARGYEVNVTPLQLLAAYDAILNDGFLRRPRLIDAVLNEDGAVIDPRAPIEGRRVCAPAAARNLRTAMLETVLKGTAKKAALVGFEVGGKTGTAQRWDPKLGKEGAYSEDACNLSFFGFVKSARRIELAALVVVEDPEVHETLEFAGSIAVPVFRRIAERVLAHRGVEPNADSIRKAELASGR